jgi:hypothetical protein
VLDRFKSDWGRLSGELVRWRGQARATRQATLQFFDAFDAAATEISGRNKSSVAVVLPQASLR